jgi:hypothetical protein
MAPVSGGVWPFNGASIGLSGIGRHAVQKTSGAIRTRKNRQDELRDSLHSLEGVLRVYNKTDMSNSICAIGVARCTGGETGRPAVRGNVEVPNVEVESTIGQLPLETALQVNEPAILS